MKRFVAIWAGQLLTQLGSGLTTFALAVEIYRQTGAVADLALLTAAGFVPQVIVAPYGGVLADRHDRRRLMLGADAGAAAITALLLVVVAAGHLQAWSAAILVAASASCAALQWPASEAAAVALVSPDQLGRAAGLTELSRGISQLLAPPIAGALVVVIGLEGILVVDLASFAVGVVPLVVTQVPAHAPRPPHHRRGLCGQLHDLASAWRLIAGRPGLVAMLALFAVTSFTFAVADLMLRPLVLDLATPQHLGVVLAAVGVGMVAGALAMSVWGAPRRKVIAILLFQLVEGGALIAAGVWPTFGPLVAAALAYGLVIPLTFGCARALWQIKVPADHQGRVAALRNALVVLAIPVGYAVAPLLAGLGHARVIVAMGVATCAAAVTAFAFSPYRRLDRRDDDLLVPSPHAAAGRP